MALSSESDNMLGWYHADVLCDDLLIACFLLYQYPCTSCQYGSCEQQPGVKGHIFVCELAWA